MNFLDKQIEALDCQILEYYEKFDCYLHTIPGIGIIGAATILAEIGDISRFKNSSSLIAFAGIDQLYVSRVNLTAHITICQNVVHLT